jgi:hypothetical protein
MDSGQWTVDDLSPSRRYKVIFTAGPDMVIVDDVTRYGLHRRHIVRLGGFPDEAWLDTVEDARVHAWQYMDDHNVGHLWMAWKEG